MACTSSSWGRNTDGQRDGGGGDPDTAPAPSLSFVVGDEAGLQFLAEALQHLASVVGEVQVPHLLGRHWHQRKRLLVLPQLPPGQTHLGHDGPLALPVDRYVGGVHPGLEW